MRPAVSPYIYDANGNRTGGNNGGAAISASYDGQDRLSSYNGVSTPTASF
jgi:YD repeat-containing protein